MMNHHFVKRLMAMCLALILCCGSLGCMSASA